jgi:hypothetical protein
LPCTDCGVAARLLGGGIAAEIWWPMKCSS